MATPFPRMRGKAAPPPTSTSSNGRGHLPSSAQKRVYAPRSIEGGVTPRRYVAPQTALSAASITLSEVLERRNATRGLATRGAARRGDGAPSLTPDRARQVLAWEMYDQVGELRQATTLMADAVASADLYVGRLVPGQQQPERVNEDDPTEEMLPPEAAQAVDEALRSLVGSGAMERMAAQLFVGAETFLLGVPANLDDAKPVEDDEDGLAPTGRALDENGEVERITPFDEGLTWHALSFDELVLAGDPERDNPRAERADDGTMDALLDGEWHTLLVDRVIGLSLWQAHPRRSDRLDSGVLSALPVLLQLVATGQYAQAAIDSRLAGSGVFVIPQSALGLPAGATEEEVEAAVDDFMEDLTSSMLTPIEDRSDPSAVVPITLAVADEAVGAFKHYTFDLPLTDVSDDREEHLIRRLARSLDLPPEQLLGMADMNHWSAWQVDEATVKAHVEPMLEVICSALTRDILLPTLQSSGESRPRQWKVGYDTSRLVLRPNRGGEAQALYDRGAIDDTTLRRAHGFDEGDAPVVDADPWGAAVDEALRMATAAPSLAQDPGLGALATAIHALRIASGPGALPAAPAAPGEPPSPAESTAPPVVDDSAVPDTVEEQPEPEPAPVPVGASP